MDNLDWRDILGATLSDTDRAQLDEEAARQQATENKSEDAQRAPLEVIVERKGRAGKTATIVCGFTVSDSRLKEIATELRQSLGCGGSSRDGEILLQGERKEAVAKILKSKGYKIKGC